MIAMANVVTRLLQVGAQLMGSLAQGTGATDAGLRSSLMAGKIDPRSVDLAGKDLSGIVLKHHANVSLHDCNIAGARLAGAWLIQNNMRNVHAVNTNFSQARLSKADCSNGDFSGALFKGAYLDGVNFTGARNLTVEQLLSARSIKGIRLDGPLAEALQAKQKGLR